MSTANPTDTGSHAETLTTIRRVLGTESLTTARFEDNLRVYVPAERLLDVARALKTERGYAFLSEVGGVDYLGYPEKKANRFEVHYVLRNLESGEWVVLKVGLDDPEPKLDSVVSLWKGADWMEREVFDMYGITFVGHPDLRRILMPPEFTAFPLRKDYPLRGRGERHNFTRIMRGDS
ncbi:NADH-quinone oxidoreductase subunit C [Singulisphaera rosea]